jgi:two-component system sensor kinase ParS
VLEILDQGIGIAAADRTAIFEPFFRTRDARQSGTPGIGLGLALAQRIALSLGGQLSCESNSHNGSRFWLTFPSDRSR